MNLTFTEYVDKVLFYMDNEYTKDTNVGLGTSDLSDSTSVSVTVDSSVIDVDTVIIDTSSFK